jgi:uncharacterized RDD family membrane protein YckC
VKCPKCHYLGFETGDRCRNCGYDFSLIVDGEGDLRLADAELDRDGAEDTPTPTDWMRLAEAAAPPAVQIPSPAEDVPRRPPLQSSMDPKLHSERAPATRESRLPLFGASSAGRGDEPLIKLPVTPRAPLAVRRTPDTPRARAVSRAVRSPEQEPPLEFGEAVIRTPEPAVPEAPARSVSRARPVESEHVQGDVSGPSVRVAAGAIDHVLLGAIDLAVIYFTLRISGLAMSDWAALPVVPLLSFLFLVKLAYFAAFTAVGGQTIGKMALHIRVVTEDHRSIDPTVALQRALVGVASTVVFGLGLLPAFFDPERRAFHDRVTRTRVIALRPA